MNCPVCKAPTADEATACGACGAPLAGPPAPTAPSQPFVRPELLAPPPGTDPYLGRLLGGKFQILEMIGQGGMGKVYKARHVTLDKVICIKVLKPALLADETVVGRFEREAKSASRLNHANSIQVLDFGRDELGTLYIAMEFVTGKDLRRTLRDEFPLDEPRICRIVAQVLSALSEAHAQNVIHRDLKPENIMVEQRRGHPDHVKVLDFGIAKIQEADSPGLTRADAVCGTPLYMSPEQATGSPFDARADLYAIGVILYQLSTGALPFDGSNSHQILMKHVTEMPVPPRQRRPEGISAEMEALILRAMSKDASKRPQTAEAFRQEILSIEAMHAKPAPAAAPAPEPADDPSDEEVLPTRKAPVPAWMVAAVAVLAIGGYLALGSRSSPEPAAPSPAPVAAVPAPAMAEPTKPVEAKPVEAKPVEAKPVEAKPVEAKPVEAKPAPAKLVEQLRVDAPIPKVVLPAPVVAKLAAPASPERARALLEEADLAFEEENFPKAIAQYRAAVQADVSLAKAYKGLFRAGMASGDLKAAKAGGQGYLKLAPTAPDAGAVRAQLQQIP